MVEIGVEPRLEKKNKSFQFSQFEVFTIVVMPVCARVALRARVRACVCIYNELVFP